MASNCPMCGEPWNRDICGCCGWCEDESAAAALRLRLRPAPRAKIYHMATKINQRGGVSALCFAQPRSINLARASWVLSPENVTCPRCKRLMVKLDVPTSPEVPDDDR